MDGYKRLEDSIIDNIKEEQAKLGYLKEDIRLYYPLDSLKHIMDVNSDGSEMKKQLEHFSEYTAKRLGKVKISEKNERFCFHIPEQGSVYVHENTGENEFIKKLVDLVGRHGCSRNDIKELFVKEYPVVEEEEVNDDEFDFLLYFAGNPSDRYYYCFKDEGCHMIYHRFTPEDYADIYR